MSMQDGSRSCIAGSGAGFTQRPATFPMPAHRSRLLREPHSGRSHVSPFAASAGVGIRIGSRAKTFRFFLHRRMTGSQKLSTQQNCCPNRPILSSPVCVWRRGISMAHDQNGRVGPPRCEECNAPLSSDERRQDSTSSRFLCLECQLALNPFRKVKRKRRRRAQKSRAVLLSC